ncbi:N-6 DNA methylase [Cellulomonas sp. NPDC058312]|uniref:N-6 DNA methylase n=1 Tax=Cellulomonas sp. NPDC058312 TaxID=3346441 RepID=UPI0036EFB031
MIDVHYTPNWLAKAMIELLPEGTSSVGDFCMGEGALLEAAEARFGQAAAYFGSDIDARAVRRARAAHSNWVVSLADLLSVSSLKSSRAWSPDSFDAIVLNPPFSYRGGSGALIAVPALGTIRASPAVAYVDNALRALAPGGTAVLLLPANTLSSERDRAWWAYARGRWSVTVELTSGPRDFPGVVARMAVVRLSPRLDGVALASDPMQAESAWGRPLSIVRGRVPVHSLGRFSVGSDDGVPFVHSTDLRGDLQIHGRPRVVARLGTRGPLVLLPRVGALKQEKIVVWVDAAPIALSDCVFGLRVPVEQVVILAKQLRDRADLISGRYGGSCAPYLTISRLSELLSELGWDPAHVGAQA